MAVSTFRLILLCSLVGLVCCNLAPKVQKPLVQPDDVKMESIRPGKAVPKTRNRRQAGGTVLNAANNYGFVDNESSQPGSGANARVPNNQGGNTNRPGGNTNRPGGNTNRPVGNTNSGIRPNSNNNGLLSNIFGTGGTVGSNLNILGNRPTGTGNRPTGNRPTGNNRPTTTGNNRPSGIGGSLSGLNPFSAPAQRPAPQVNPSNQDDSGDVQFPTRTESDSYPWQGYYDQPEHHYGWYH